MPRYRITFIRTVIVNADDRLAAQEQAAGLMDRGSSLIESYVDTELVEEEEEEETSKTKD